MKNLANRHSLSRHKKTCPARLFQGRKRPSDDNGVGPSNPKMQSLADAIINDTLVHNQRPVEDALHNTALPSPQPFQKLPPPGEVFQKLSSPRPVFRKLPSPPPEVVDEVFQKSPPPVFRKLPSDRKSVV